MKSKSFITVGGSWHTVFNNDFWYYADLSLEARALWLTLRSHASPNSPNPFPSYKRIARIHRWHINTISKYIQELEEKHYLSRHVTKFKVTIYCLFEHPKQWQPAPRMKIAKVDGKYVAVNVTDRDEDEESAWQAALTKYRNDDHNSCEHRSQNLGTCVHKISDPCTPENLNGSPVNIDEKRDPKSSKKTQGKKEPREVGAATPPADATRSSSEDPGHTPVTRPSSQGPDPEDEEEETEEQRAFKLTMEFSQAYPKALQILADRRNIIMTEEGRSKAREFFLENPRWSHIDAMWVGLQAQDAVNRNSYRDGDGVDAYWNCRRFTSPNMLFSRNSNEEFRILLMAKELNYEPYDHAPEEVTKTLAKLVASYRKKKQ